MHIVLIITNVISVVAAVVKMLPEFFQLIKSIDGIENLGAIKDKLERDKTRIKDAFKDADPESRSSKLNDIFSK